MSALFLRVPQVGELPYLASWAAHLAAIGTRLPEQQLEALCSYVAQRKKKLQQGDGKKLRSTFKAWRYERGLAMLQQVDAGTES